jgi:hypothetical protein
MSFILSNRTKEITTTTGTGTITLGGAVTGFQPFSSVLSNGDQCYYTLQSVDSVGNPVGAWEIGVGLYNTAANTLTRTLAASSTGSLINLSGLTQIWVDQPAGVAGGGLLNIRTFSTVGSFTYTPFSGARSALADLIGGGGGGGGTPATGSGQIATGGPGGSGGWCRHYFAVNGSLTGNVGAAGAAGSAGGNGGNGGASTLAGASAGGGTGGLAGAVSSAQGAVSVSGAGGTASGGSVINIPGAATSVSMIIVPAGIVLPGPANPAPLMGVSFGAGAAGRGAGSSTGSLTGFAGNPGIVIVYEFS